MTSTSAYSSALYRNEKEEAVQNKREREKHTAGPMPWYLDGISFKGKELITRTAGGEMLIISASSLALMELLPDIWWLQRHPAEPALLRSAPLASPTAAECLPVERDEHHTRVIH